MRTVATSVFEPNSPQARAIEHLFYFDLLIAVVIFLTVAGLVSYAVLKFRRRVHPGDPYQDPGNPKLETLWTVIPAAILLVLLVLTGRTMAVVSPLVGSHPPDVVVVAHQWWWEFRYPKSGVLTANELHMPEGKRWLLKLESADVIHDFWVPDLGAKEDCIPNHTNYLWIRPQRAGIYLGTCAEFCGTDHALMGIRVIVQPLAEFKQWEQEQLQYPAEPTGGVALEGEKLLEANICMNCHAGGQIGPDLTHVGDRQTLGAGVISNTVENLTRWIEDPQKIKPGCHMPDLHLTSTEAHDIAVYLEGLK
jgi:cytochrome c oxidase subunit 2